MAMTVHDEDTSHVLSRKYDLAFFCSGYEERCISFPQQCESIEIAEVVVLGFSQLSESPQRRKNDEYYRTKWKREAVLLNADDDSAIYEHLRQTQQLGREVVRLLVDYSSMSRLWYAAIINWARFAPQFTSVEIEFVYSVGVYEEALIPIVINDMLVIPGCEGGTLRFMKAVAVFGLGFYGMMAHCVLENLEPDSVFAFLASPGASPSYVDMVKESNEAVLDDADAVLEVPLASVEATVRYLTEMILPELPHSEVVLVPMGPKPHVLACILIAMRFGDVTCLRVSAKRERPEQVPASGQVVATRVIIQR